MTSDRWNSQEYASHSLNQKRWGAELAGRLAPKKSDQVLDIGSGDGMLTALIAERVTHGFAIGLDSSPEMVSHALETYPGNRFSNLHFLLGDASSLPFAGVFDAVFSNATLHWVLDQRPVLEGVTRVLKPSGRLLFQMGGKGNARMVTRALDQLIHGNEWSPFFIPFHFPYGFFGPDEYRNWLAQAGLDPLRVELVLKDATFDDDAIFRSWIRTTWLRYTYRVPQHRRESFISELAEIYASLVPPGPGGIITVKMVRLEVEARRPG